MPPETLLNKKEIDKNQSSSPESSPSIKKSYFIMKKIINKAIYVEKPLPDPISPKSESSSRVSTFRQDDEITNFKGRKTKRCTCASNAENCPFHADTQPQQSSPTCEMELVKKGADKERRIKKWINKKEQEKKLRELKQRLIQEEQDKQKEKMLERERNNFKAWLKNKKKIEAEKKKQKERDLRDQELKKMEKEKRQLENQLNYELWIKKKEEAVLDKKIKEQLHFIKSIEQREQKLEDNEKAFKDWLKSAQNKPKPVAPNEGLESLRLSKSVTYINPVPWTPNINID